MAAKPASRAVTIYTPGSTAGVQVDLLGALPRHLLTRLGEQLREERPEVLHALMADSPLATLVTLADGSTGVIYDLRPKAGRSRVIAARFAPEGRVFATAAFARALEASGLADVRSSQVRVWAAATS